MDSLREAQEWGLAALERVTDPVDAKRARHILTENTRVIADTGVAAGALGAGMTGGGFGGCVIALASQDALDAIATAVPSALRGAGFNQPTVVRATAASGAGPVAPEG